MPSKDSVRSQGVWSAWSQAKLCYKHHLPLLSFHLTHWVPTFQLVCGNTAPLTTPLHHPHLILYPGWEGALELHWKVPLLGLLLYFVYISTFVRLFFFFNVYLFLRERQNVSRGMAAREGDTESKAGSRL